MGSYPCSSNIRLAQQIMSTCCSCELFLHIGLLSYCNTTVDLQRHILWVFLILNWPFHYSLRTENEHLDGSWGTLRHATAAVGNLYTSRHSPQVSKHVRSNCELWAGRPGGGFTEQEQKWAAVIEHVIRINVALLHICCFWSCQFWKILFLHNRLHSKKWYGLAVQFTWLQNFISTL